MQQEPKPSIRDASTDPAFRLPGLDWMGSHAFKARYAVQPGIDRDFGTWWGPRHNQSISHHLATLDSPTGLAYAYDPTWDEYAVLATDVPATTVQTVMNRALANDRHMPPEGFAGLMTDHLMAAAPDAQTTTHLPDRIELRQQAVVHGNHDESARNPARDLVVDHAPRRLVAEGPAATVNHEDDRRSVRMGRRIDVEALLQVGAVTDVADHARPDLLNRW